MNNPSPLIPQGSLLEQKNKSRARVKVAFFCVVGVHVAAILVALLAQGCKREQPNVTGETGQPAVPITDTNVAPPELDTNLAPATLTSNNAVSLPPVVEPVAPPVVAAEQEYVIQKGDTFSTIAPKFHITVKALQAANPTVDASKLQIGKKIKIPAPAPAAAPSTGTAVAPVADSGEPIYVVKSGDTLSKIATDHHTTINALRKANNLTTDRIKVGDKLKIPVSAPTAPPPAPTTGAPPQ